MEYVHESFRNSLEEDVETYLQKPEVKKLIANVESYLERKGLEKFFNGRGSSYFINSIWYSKEACVHLHHYILTAHFELYIISPSDSSFLEEFKKEFPQLEPCGDWTKRSFIKKNCT